MCIFCIIMQCFPLIDFTVPQFPAFTIHSFIWDGLPQINYHPPQIDFWHWPFLLTMCVLGVGYVSFPALPWSVALTPHILYNRLIRCHGINTVLWSQSILMPSKAASNLLLQNRVEYGCCPLVTLAKCQNSVKLIGCKYSEVKKNTSVIITCVRCIHASSM